MNDLKPCSVCGQSVDNEVETKYQWNGGISDSTIGSVTLRHHCDKPVGVFSYYTYLHAKTMDDLVNTWNNAQNRSYV